MQSLKFLSAAQNKIESLPQVSVAGGTLRRKKKGKGPCTYDVCINIGILDTLPCPSQYLFHATSLPLARNWPTPLPHSADVIRTCP